MARTQAAGVADELARLGHETLLVTIRTAGDRSAATSFGDIGPQGVFVREIEQALLNGAVDLAVHSYKDLPTRSPAQLTIAAVPARRDAADVLVMTKEAASADQGLPIASGSRVGTASARRQAWIRHLRPDIAVVPIRGNVPTRINRLHGDLDGVVLAAAGLERLRRSSLEGVSDPVTGQLALGRLPPEQFVPAPAQGALAIQCRRADAGICELLAVFDDATMLAIMEQEEAGLDATTRKLVQCERDLLARAEGGCELAFGAYCAESWPGPRHTTDTTSTQDIAGESSHGELQLVAWLERQGTIHKAHARATDCGQLVNSAWAGLQRQWTG